MHGEAKQTLQALGVSVPIRGLGIGSQWEPGRGESIASRSPIDGSTLAEFLAASSEQVERAIQSAANAFPTWRDTPAPQRGELVRQLGNAFREHQTELATLVTSEVGKIPAEARGEIQEVIDICDFAVGLSRQLYGKTIASERPGHRLAEYWHPLGPVGVISAFNFPVAVWAWNAMIGLVCGDPDRLEAVGEDAAVCGGVPGIGAACDRTISGHAVGNLELGDRPRRRRTGAIGIALGTAGVSDWISADGPHSRANGWVAAGPHAVGTWRQ